MCHLCSKDDDNLYSLYSYIASIIAVILSCSCIHGYLKSPHGVSETMNYEHKGQIDLVIQITLQKDIITVGYIPRMIIVLHISHINYCHVNAVFKFAKPPICLMIGNCSVIVCSMFNSDSSVFSSNLIAILIQTTLI